MLTWIAENAATVIVLAAVAAVIALAVRSLIKQKKSGAVCTGNCATCGMSCHCGETERNHGDRKV